MALDVSDATEFVESMHSDVFKDRVYVFTPRGDIIDLPAGSTPIDFAYHVHTILDIAAAAQKLTEN